jgi:hypothetical protein
MADGTAVEVAQVVYVSAYRHDVGRSTCGSADNARVATGLNRHEQLTAAGEENLRSTGQKIVLGGSGTGMML